MTTKDKKIALRDKTTEQLREDVRVGMGSLMLELLVAARVTHFASRVEHMNLAYIEALGEDFDKLGFHLMKAGEAFRTSAAAYALLVERGKRGKKR